MKRHGTLTLLLVGGLSMLLALGGCDSLTSYNDNPNQATSANPNNLLANAQRALAGETFGGTRTMRRANVWAQYTTQNFYPSESRYSPVNYGWGGMYNALNDLKRAKVLTRQDDGGGATNPANVRAVATVMQVWAFQILTDAYGDIPVNEALQGTANRSPRYMPQDSVYRALNDSLNTALSTINADGDGPSGDLVHGGDMEKWQRFANGLKMRLGIRGYEAAGGSDSWAADAITSANGNALQSNEDNTYFQFGTSATHRNSYYDNRVTSFRDDFDGSDRFISFMQSNYGTADPRLDAFFEQTSNSNRPCEDGSGEYQGFPYGLEQGDAQDQYSASPTCNYSRPEAWFPEGPSGDGDAFAPMMYYDEVLFTKAWAAEEGLIGGDPETLLADAIEASVDFYGTETDADISSSDDATQSYISAVQSEYSSSTSDEVIGEQRYIAFYMHNIQGWSTWRRFDFGGVIGSPEGGVAGGFTSYVPLRVDYPDSEYNYNGTNVEAAASNMCGGVDSEDEACQVWWDTEGPPDDPHN